MQLNHLTAIRADRMERIVVNLGTGNDWNLLVEQIG